MFLKENRLYVLMLVVIAFIITISWFHTGKFIASGEPGFWMYDAENTLNKSSFVWLNYDTGWISPSFIPRLPLLYTLAFLQNFMTPVFSQALLFCILILLGLVGMYLLGKDVFRNKDKLRISFLAALFYFFNLYTMSQVWNRILYAGFFLWAYLPWFLLFAKQIIDKFSRRDIILFVLTNLIFSMTYVVASYVFALWLPVIIYVLTKILLAKNFKLLLGYALRSLALLLLWLLVNIWWIYPFLVLGQNLFYETFGWQYNYNSLRGITSMIDWWNYINLYHNNYMENASLWGEWYMKTAPLIVSFLVPIVALYGFVKMSNKKTKTIYAFVSILLVVTLFIVKGTNPPFGDAFYRWLFQTLPQMGILRNPYEKVGVVLVLDYSLLFGYGLSHLYSRSKSVSVAVLLFANAYLVWPIWTGDVYAEAARISLPGYYRDANNYMNDDTDSRILVMPMLPGDGAKYKWGYQGIEISDFIYSKPTISKIYRMKIPDEKYYSLYNDFVNYKNISSHLSDLNVRYIVVDYSLDEAVSGASDSASVSKRLKGMQYLTFKKSYGSISIYEYETLGNFALIEASSEIHPEVGYVKKGPMSYKIDIKGAEQPYDLVFKYTYDPRWELRTKDETIPNHEVIYDYANLWHIDKKGDYELDLNYKLWPWD
jgi:hypothetical protein